MSEMKLSICIPTYNRERYLHNTLSRCAADFKFAFPYEIVISDNASTDDTKRVVDEFIAKGLPIRYHRRAENGGALRNIVSSLRHAVGEYALYLADDDVLIADQVAAIVAYLDANPDVVTCQAPWFLYDEVANRDTGQFYRVDRDVKFARRSFAEVFQFIYERHIFPEIGIYRTAALRSAWVPRDFCFAPFPYLAHFLDQGAVTFLKQPFYRSVTVSKIAPRRHQAGNEEVMTFWDRYRGGLEYFLYFGVKRGSIANTREARAAFEEKCKIFTFNRMAVAARFWAARNDFVKVYELFTRMAVGGMADHPDMVKLREVLPLRVALQTLAYQVDATAGLDRLILSGMADPAAIGDLLRDCGVEPRIEILDDSAAHDPARIESTAVFVSDQQRRDKYLSMGYKPGLIFTEQELVRHILV